MRVIIKNADFSVYGLEDISGLMGEITANYGNASNTAPIEKLLKALGADGRNEIWQKIKGLYMPVLSATTDGQNAFYDIIGKEKLTITYSYTIEENRGVGPTTMGGTTDAITAPDGITQTGASMFGVVTKSPRQNLGSNSGNLSTLRSIRMNWLAASIQIAGASGSASVTNADAFTKPVSYVVTGQANGNRKVFSKGSSAEGAIEASATADFKIYAGAYCDISIFGICEGLTDADAVVIENALNTFITEFGILC